MKPGWLPALLLLLVLGLGLPSPSAAAGVADAPDHPMLGACDIAAAAGACCERCPQCDAPRAPADCCPVCGGPSAGLAHAPARLPAMMARNPAPVRPGRLARRAVSPDTDPPKAASAT